MNAKRYLVTGGTGFIGSALVKRLVKDGHRVRVLDNNSRGAPRRIADIVDDIEFVEADIRDTAAVTAAAKGVDCVCHLAAVNGTEFFYSKPELVLDVSIRGMLAVIDACRANDVGDLVYASSSEVYQTPPRVPTDEDVPLSIPDVRNPRYSYGGGKIASELIAMNHGRNGFERVTVFRPHNVYGPDMGWEHVLPQFVLRAKELIAQHPDGIVPFPIQGDGSQTRAFIHIDDFTSGLIDVIDKGEHLEIYHIGNPEEVTIADLARRVVACMGRQTELIGGEEPKGATARRSPDITKLIGLGFKPKLSLDAGLPSLIDWYVANADMAPDIAK
ncbi:MAG TPA: SDR family NAD(P)-dependent oxidoreductase [Rhodospirillales bacterium]|nr:SDR family NAD(P)-dependent oxidoreductase [Rhodospirillales bacterium]